MKRKYFLVLALIITVLTGYAQEDINKPLRPVTSVLQVLAGRMSVRDTYLTPQLYKGWNWGMQYERWHAWKQPNWGSQQKISARFGMPEDRGNHSEEWVGRFVYRYAAHYRWDQLWGRPLTLMTGVFTGVEAGFDYNLKLASGNNPATAKVATNVGVSGIGVWHYQLRKQECSAMLQVQLPLLGYALQPEYGASYYESFYLETAGNNHHFTSWHNRQDLDVRLTADLAVSAIPCFASNANSLRLGVEYHIETMDINQVTTRFSSFDFVVGVVFQHLKYNKQKKNLLNRSFYEAY